MKKQSIKGAILFLMLLCVACLTGACGRKEEASEYKVYYLDMDVTGLKSESCSLETENCSDSDLVRQLLDRMAEEPPKADLRRIFSGNVDYRSFSIQEYLVTVDLTEAYLELSPAEEVLSRAAIVRTLAQIPEILYVSFTVNGEPLLDRDGAVIGKMSPEDFLENPEAAINTNINAQITLYLADAEGNHLIPVTRDVTYSANTPLEKVIMRQLILGTTTAGYQSTLPMGTKLISISVMDGICYVNLDEALRNNQNSSITEKVMLYSIVNSLTELENVDKVQLAINGDTNGKVWFNYDLSTFYEANMEMVEYSGQGLLRQEPSDTEKAEEVPHS